MLYYVQFKNEYLNTEDRRHVRQTEVKNEADMRRTKESRREKVIQQPEGDNSDWYKHAEF